jgi:hypothetical protein
MVSLGKCESSLNGGTEYDSFEEYVRILTIRLLANARAEVNKQEGTFCVRSYSGRSFVVKTYEACPESKYTKVLNMYSIFNLQKRHCEWIACT